MAFKPSPFVASFLLLLLVQERATAQEEAPETSTDTIKVAATKVEALRKSPDLVVSQVEPVQAGLGSRIRVTVEGLSNKIEEENFDPGTYVLYLAGRPLPGHHPVGVDPANEVLTFDLKRTDAAKETWNALLGSPRGFTQGVRLGVGSPAGQELPQQDRGQPVVLDLTIIRPGWSLAVSFTLVAFLIVFILLARTTDLIRDSVPPDPPPGKKRPYSLGRTQMATWLFVIIGSFAFVYAITGHFTNIITNHALILMGIGIGTALGSSAIDENKEEQIHETIRTLLPRWARLREEIQISREQIPQTENPDQKALLRADLEEKKARLKGLDDSLADAQSNLSKPISTGILSDLITDANGVSLHRFQMLIWTTILVLLFIDGVYKNLAMPELDNTLLALMGISSGTYLGFKIPERQVATPT